MSISKNVITTRPGHHCNVDRLLLPAGIGNQNTLYGQTPCKHSLQVHFSYSAALEANDEKSTINT
jgi:hypothetical protein